MASRLNMLFTNPLQFLYITLLMLPGLLIGFSLHEAGHAFMAYRCGDKTAKNLGRMTLDPLSHLDPLGFISLLLFGFGWAKPVPVNPNNYKNRRQGEFLVSIAGITMNFILGILFTLLYVLLLKFHVTNITILLIVQYAVSINFLLMIFNLLPIPPLDGEGILTSIFWKSYKLQSFFRDNAQVIYIVFLLAIFSGTISMIISPAVTFFSNTFYRLFSILLGV